MIIIIIIVLLVSNDIDWVGLCELDKIIPLTGDLSVVKLTQGLI